MEKPPLTVPNNPAIARCQNAWNSAYRYELERKEYEETAIRRANKAFRCAMPALDSPENIRDFVACAAYAMLIGAIDPRNGSNILYAAQVAFGAAKHQPIAPQVVPSPL